MLKNVIDRPKRILIVDDNRTFVTYVSLLLRKMGFTKTIIAENGVEALKLLKLWRPDIVMMDVHMPGMGGIEAVTRMKESRDTADIPVVLVSSSPDERIYEDTLELGCVGLLRKPFSVDVLYDIIQESLSQSGSNRREHIRIPYENKVAVLIDGKAEVCYSVSLSEGGIYIRRNPPLVVGTELEVIVSINDRPMHIKGAVIYTKEFSAESLNVPPGMAVKFKDVSAESIAVLGAFIKDLISTDVY